MASIDKTYTDSYQDYKEFKDWADKQILTFFDGHKECIGNWVWEYNEKDFDGQEIPIMNTPTWLDIYLIQNCKSKFVLDRMKEVYDEKSYKEFQTIDLTANPPQEFQQNRKISIVKTHKTKYALHSKPYNGYKWLLQCNDDSFWYNDNTKVWANWNYYPHNTNTADLTSIKAVVRHLRKQYLPKGITFRLIGRYVGEEYLIRIS